MKKLLSILLCLALLVCAVPVFAADAPAGEEYVFCYERMFVELAADRAAEAEALRQTLSAMEGVAWVEPSRVGGYVFDRDEETCVYWTVSLCAPYAENYEKAATVLCASPAVLRITQNVYGVCLNGDVYDLRTMVFVTDIPDTDEARVIGVQAELGALPGVLSVADNGIGKGNWQDGTMIFFLTIREPVGANYPAVLAYLKSQPYFRGVLYNPVTGDPATYDYGDADMDGKVTAADARSILRYAVKLAYPGSYRQVLLCDMDLDGKIAAADARYCLRTAVALEKKNPCEYIIPQYEGLVVSASVSLNRTGTGLALSATTVGGAAVTACGFESLRLQRLTDGVWTDVPGLTWENLRTSGNSSVFSKTVAVPSGTYRLICVHFANAPYRNAYSRTARFSSVSEAVTLT